MTPELVVNEIKKLIAAGSRREDLNANIVIDSLGTKARQSVYKYYRQWEREQVETLTLPDVAMPPEGAARVIAAVEMTISQIIANDRVMLNELMDAAKAQIVSATAASDTLLKALEDTEAERDEAEERANQYAQELAGCRQELAISLAISAREVEEREKLTKDLMVAKADAESARASAEMVLARANKADDEREQIMERLYRKAGLAPDDMT